MLAATARVQRSLARYDVLNRPIGGSYPGKQNWINGYGVEGQPMLFCPSNCTDNTDASTEVAGHPYYSKSWDPFGWRQPTYWPARSSHSLAGRAAAWPVRGARTAPRDPAGASCRYSKQSQEEIDAGFTQGQSGFVHAGEATLCKKPYPVCDYPNGDVFARDALQKIQAKSVDEQCRASMKIFLCALYRRRCLDFRDLDVASATFGRRGVYPVCWDQCYNGYLDCGFNKQVYAPPLHPHGALRRARAARGRG